MNKARRKATSRIQDELEKARRLAHCQNLMMRISDRLEIALPLCLSLASQPEGLARDRRELATGHSKGTLFADTAAAEHESKLSRRRDSARGRLRQLLQNRVPAID